MSHQRARPEDVPEYFTRAGLAADFGISERTIEHYIQCGRVPPALGRYPNGLNYDDTHYQAIAKIRRDLTSRVPLTRRRKRRPHVVIVAQREASLA